MRRELTDKIQEVRRRLRIFHGLRGFAMLVAVAIGFAWVSLLLDAFLHLNSYVRWAMLIIGVGGVATAAAVWFLFPLFRPIWDEEIALLIEVTYPTLKDRLISTLQLKRSELPEGILGSQELINALEHQTAGMLYPMDVSQAVRFHQLRRLLLLASALVALMGALQLVRPDALATWWTRFWDPYSDITWTNTKLDLEPKKAIVPQGESFTVKALAYQNGGPVDQVTLFTQHTGERWTPLNMSKSEDRYFTYTFPEVHRGFRYYAQAGDAKTHPYEVQVVPRPAIMGVTVDYTYPAYTRKEAKQDKGDGVIEALKGTQVRLVVRASTDLKGGHMEFNIGGHKKILPLEVKGNEGLARFPVEGSGSYAITVISNANLANREPFERPIHAMDDLPPIVAIPVPGQELKCTPNAEIPLLATASDDYGIVERGSLKAVKESEEPSQPVVSPLTWIPPDRQRPHFTEAHAVLSLVQFANLNPGDAVKYWAEARDNNPSGTGLGKSEAYRIAIVSEEEKERDFAIQAEAIKAKMDELVKEQEKLTKQTEQLRKQSMVDPTVKNDVLQAERKQGEMMEGMKDVLAKLRHLEQDRKNNKMTPPEPMKQLEQFRQQSSQLADQEMPKAAQQLAQVQQEQNPQSAQKQMQQAHQQEESILNHMKRLQQEMAKMTQMAAIHKQLQEMVEKETQLQKETKELNEALFNADFDPSKMKPEDRDKQERVAQRQGELAKQFRDFQKSLEKEAQTKPELQPLAEKAASEPNVQHMMREAERQVTQARFDEAGKKQTDILKALTDLQKEARAAEAQMNREPTAAEKAAQEAAEAKQAAEEAKQSAKEAEEAAKRAEEEARRAAEEAQKRPNAADQAKKKPREPNRRPTRLGRRPGKLSKPLRKPKKGPRNLKREPRKPRQANNNRINNRLKGASKKPRRVIEKPNRPPERQRKPGIEQKKRKASPKKSVRNHPLKWGWKPFGNN